jgi:hypothetical protein
MGRIKSKEMVVHTFEVELDDDESLDYYEGLLTRYNQWKVFKREVRLTGLLNSGKKIQFDIEDANLLIYTDMDAIQYIHKAVFRADNITFILKDEEIVSMSLSGETLPTSMGNFIKGILDEGIPLKIKKYNDKQGRITFYIDIEDDKAA